MNTTTTEPKEGTMHSTTTTTPVLVDVSVQWKDGDKFSVGYWAVEPVWSGVDRPNTGGWGLADEPKARRLERAIRAGVVCTDPKVLTDVDGNTYVSHGGHLRVSTRHLNADLKRLGF